MQPEIRFDVPREEYDRIQADSWSRIKLIAKSPAHYKYGIEHEQEDTDALRFGRAAHLAVLEPAELLKRVIVWEGGARRGKAWDAFREQHAGREILTESEGDLLKDMTLAVRRCEYAQPYLTGGHAEVTLTWGTEVVPGHVVATKGRIDYETQDALVDVKFVRCASPEAFARQAWDLGYLGQSALYTDGYAAATGRRKPFVFVAVEKEPPFCVGVYVVTEEQLARGRSEYMRCLATLSMCRIDNAWPGYVTAPVPLTLPRWAANLAAEELAAEQAEGAAQ